MAAARRRAARLAAHPVGPTAAARPAASAAPHRRRQARGASGPGALLGARADAGAAGAGRHRACARSATRSPPTCRRPWQRSVRAAAVGRSADVRDRLDQAVVGTDLGRRPGPALVAGRRRGAVAARRCGRRRRRLAAGRWPSAATSCCPTPPTPDAGGHRGAHPAARRRGAARAAARCGRPAARPRRCRRTAPPRGVAAAVGDREGRRRADARARSRPSWPGTHAPGWRWTGPAPADRSTVVHSGADPAGCPQIAPPAPVVGVPVAHRRHRGGTRPRGARRTAMNETVVTVVGHVASEPSLRVTSTGAHGWRASGSRPPSAATTRGM